MPQFIKCAAAILLLTAGIFRPVYAHHSTAMFDADNPIELAGTIKEWQYSNPHTFIILIVSDENGDDTEWTLEGRSPSAIYRLGWTPNSLQPGDRIMLSVNPLHSGAPGGNYSNIRWHDGTPIDPTLARPEQN
tara:strand:+ start:23143 stop:23541 length:399 start_codon:yes stop_codon:yes gene_type:complete